MKRIESSVCIIEQFEQYLAGPQIGNVFGTMYLEYSVSKEA